MDAGTAAVLGALAGSVATIGAALATGWAQREGARITARSEHRRERREPRHNVYKEFIAEASRMRNLVGVFAIGAEMIDRIPLRFLSDEFISDLFNLSDIVKSKSTDAALAGPREIAEAATRVANLSHELVIDLKALKEVSEDDESHDGQFLRHVQEVTYASARAFRNSLDEFILCAQAALDDDGTGG
ncbi:hypothetical protein [Streptomyces cadmiisoli]|uniref:hypothetical protein n=1 Tax=Streptomyces cadmiisoli TaxID=2184053 RepID=UPI00365784D9